MKLQSIADFIWMHIEHPISYYCQFTFYKRIIYYIYIIKNLYLKDFVPFYMYNQFNSGYSIRAEFRNLIDVSIKLFVRNIIGTLLFINKGFFIHTLTSLLNCYTIHYHRKCLASIYYQNIYDLRKK